jgi:membrane-associated phospholipid phosphatase
MRGVLLAGLATALMPRWVIVWWGYAVFVGFWVVVSGMHLATDAVGGLLLGGALVAAVNCPRPSGGVRASEVVD